MRTISNWQLLPNISRNNCRLKNIMSRKLPIPWKGHQMRNEWSSIIIQYVQCTPGPLTHRTQQQGDEEFGDFFPKATAGFIWPCLWHFLMTFKVYVPTFENGPNIQASCQDESTEEGNRLCQRFKNCSYRKIIFDIASHLVEILKYDSIPSSVRWLRM